jgi:hypothetical protein
MFRIAVRFRIGSQLAGDGALKRTTTGHALYHHERRLFGTQILST